MLKVDVNLSFVEDDIKALAYILGCDVSGEIDLTAAIKKVIHGFKKVCEKEALFQRDLRQGNSSIVDLWQRINDYLEKGNLQEIRLSTDDLKRIQIILGKSIPLKPQIKKRKNTYSLSLCPLCGYRVDHYYHETLEPVIMCPRCYQLIKLREKNGKKIRE